MKLAWTPHESLGPFHLGSPVETANGIATLIETPTDVDDVAQLRSFVTPDGALRLEVGDDGMIASISATRSFLLGERNLIGRSLADAQSVLGVAAAYRVVGRTDPRHLRHRRHALGHDEFHRRPDVRPGFPGVPAVVGRHQRRGA